MGHTLDEALDWLGRAGIGTEQQRARVRAVRGPVTRPPPLSALQVASDGPINVMDTITRAADAGYRIVVAVAGQGQTRRRALQARLEREVVARNPARWFVLTSAADAFRAGEQNTPNPLLADLPEKRVLIVVRGTPAALGELTAWFASAEPRHLAESPALIVDAEGRDGASGSVAGRLVEALAGRTHVGRLAAG